MGESTIKNLRKGSFVLIDGVACKVVAISISKSGKHGAAKGRVDGMGLLDNRRRSLIKPADSKVQIPILLKKQAQVLAIVGERVQLMDLTDYSTFELDIPDELKGKLESGQDTTYYELEGVRTLTALK